MFLPRVSNDRLVFGCILLFIFLDQFSIFGGYNQLVPLLLLQALHRSYLSVFNKPVDSPTVTSTAMTP